MEDFVRGFIDKKQILEQVSEQQIFALVFNFIPELDKFYTSPFRVDNNASCFFEYSNKGEFRFVDYANFNVVKGVKMVNIGCFDAVRLYYNFSNFYQTLHFIKQNINKLKSINYQKIDNNIIRLKKKDKLDISVNVRPFNNKDKNYWSEYFITSNNLIEDKVFAIQGFTFDNKIKFFTQKLKTEIAYAYTDFNNNNVKLYFPEREKKNRFLTNCVEDDIGGWKNLPKISEQLVITKSYKDYRVLKNQGLNVVWFQNEGQIPDLTLLYSLIFRFKNIIIFYDNDRAGIESAQNLCNILNSLLPNICRSIYIDNLEIKDPSDLIKFYKSEAKLREFLMYKNVILQK
jgi:hypothetical protein